MNRFNGSIEFRTIGATVRLMQWHRVRGGFWALAYLALRRLFELVVLLLRSHRRNEVELLALRHENAVLRRQLGRPTLLVPRTSSMSCHQATPAVRSGHSTRRSMAINRIS